VKQYIQCDSCGKPATVHLTRIEQGGRRKEVHLCDACAEQKKVIHKQELNLSSILQVLIGQHVSPETDDLARLACPMCGIRFMEFRTEGRLGCPHDYEVFRRGLRPLLERVHRAVHHAGKKPARQVPPPEAQRELLDLRRRLHLAIEREEYEEAARIRDLLRQKGRPG
jgi:protein arginine kinase activator